MYVIKHTQYNLIRYLSFSDMLTTNSGELYLLWRKSGCTKFISIDSAIKCILAFDCDLLVGPKIAIVPYNGPLFPVI